MTQPRDNLEKIPRSLRSPGMTESLYTRREFCLAALGTAFSAATACSANASGRNAIPGSRLAARPGTPTGTVTAGLTDVIVESATVGSLYVPASYSPAKPVPLALALHGAGGSASGPMNLLRPFADSDGFVVLAVKSRAPTWDVLVGGYGPDVTVIDAALAFAFSRCHIQRQRVFVEGFSDGASYALGLGLSNGDLFRGIVAFSPGFVPPSEVHGQPKVFISHGTEDAILPIGDTSRQIVPGLRARGYTVDYREFVGPHRVPPDIARAGIDWMMAA